MCLVSLVNPVLQALYTLTRSCIHTMHKNIHTHLVTVNSTCLMATETTEGSACRKVTRTAGRGRSAAIVVSVAVNERGPCGVSSGNGTFLTLWRLISLFCISPPSSTHTALDTVVYSRLLRPSHSFKAS